MIEINGACKHGEHERFWLEVYEQCPMLKVIAVKDSQLAGQTQWSKQIQLLLIWINKLLKHQSPPDVSLLFADDMIYTFYT